MPPNHLNRLANPKPKPFKTKPPMPVSFPILPSPPNPNSRSGELHEVCVYE